MSKSRRGRGEGTIQQRPDGTWYAQLSAGVDSKGKRKRITVSGKTKFEVRDKIAKKVVAKAAGTLVSPDQVTVGGYLLRWLEAAIKHSVEGSTWDSYERYIRLHITPQIGHVRLQKLDSLHVEGMLSAMLDAGKSSRTRQYARSILVQAIDYALRDGLVQRNVAALVAAPKPTHNEMTVLNEQQTQALLKACRDEPLGCVYALSVLTGLREGEYLALQWPDIDFNSDPPVLRVRRTQSTAAKKVILKPPKTKAGTRTVTLTNAAVQILRVQQKAMLKAGFIKRQFVFLDAQGEMLTRFAEVKSCLKRIVKAAGLPQITPHDLRHTHATLLLRAGVNPKVVQERLGHSTVQITLQIYSHVLPDTQADVITKLDRLLG